jgi:hypothetical protein
VRGAEEGAFGFGTRHVISFSRGLVLRPSIVILFGSLLACAGPAATLAIFVFPVSEYVRTFTALLLFRCQFRSPRVLLVTDWLSGYAMQLHDRR